MSGFATTWDGDLQPLPSECQSQLLLGSLNQSVGVVVNVTAFHGTYLENPCLLLLQAAEHIVVSVSHLSQVHLAWQSGGLSWMGDGAWWNYILDSSSYCTVDSAGLLLLHISHTHLHNSEYLVHL